MTALTQAPADFKSAYLLALGSSSRAPSVLASKAMLVDLTIKKWGNSRQDRSVGQAVATQYGSNAKLGRFSKSLIDPKYLEPVNAKLGEIYLEHRRRTLPWLDSGPRILSAAGYLDYMTFLRTATQELETLLDTFESGYLGFVSEAAAQITGLGGLFDSTLYPPASEIRGYFDVSHRVLPMPDATDFRVELADAEVDQIREQIAGAATSALELATRDVADRITATVGKMAEKLAGYDGGKSGAFRDSLVLNVRELVDVLPSLNLTGSPDLDALTDRIRRELCPVDPDVLRKDQATREQVTQAAEDILTQMSSFI